MDYIKFDNQKLEQMFKKRTDKEHFTIEDIDSEFSITISHNDIDESLTQHDLDILLRIKDIRFDSVNFDNLKIEKTNLKRIHFYNCNLENTYIGENIIEKLEFLDCKLRNDSIKDFEKTTGLKELSIRAKTNFDMEKVHKDYPDYDNFTLDKQLEFFYSGKYKKYSPVDMSIYSKFTELESLRLDDVLIDNNLLKGIENLKNIKRLKIYGINISKDIIIPQNDSLEEVELTKLESLKILKNLTKLKKLTLYQYNEDYSDGEYLKNLDVTNLYFDSVENVLNILPLSKDIESLSLVNCGINDLNTILEYPKLKELDLDGNNIGVDKLDVLSKLVDKGIKISFKKTKVEKYLSEKEIIIDDEDLSRRFKRLFYKNKEDKITEYDVFTFCEDEVKIEGNDVLEKIIGLGLIDKLKNARVEIELYDFADKYFNMIDKYFKNVEYVSIARFKNLNEEKIAKLSKYNISVKGDLETNKFSKKYYSEEDIKSIIKVMQELKENIPDEYNELERFMYIYKSIAMYVDYDKSGCHFSEVYMAGHGNSTRSLKGALMQGKAVCVGYALVLKCCLEYIGIEAKELCGYCYGNPKFGHAWNQVKIDGKWYNTDLTWDYIDIRYGNKLEYCLVSDEKFEKDHTPDREAELVEKCTTNYDINKIEKALEKIKNTDLDKDFVVMFKKKDEEG